VKAYGLFDNTSSFVIMDFEYFNFIIKVLNFPRFGK